MRSWAVCSSWRRPGFDAGHFVKFLHLRGVQGWWLEALQTRSQTFQQNFDV